MKGEKTAGYSRSSLVVVLVGIRCQKCVGRRVSVMFCLSLNEEPKDNLLNPSLSQDSQKPVRDETDPLEASVISSISHDLF